MRERLKQIPPVPRVILGTLAAIILLSVFNAQGRRITTLHEGTVAAGPNNFDWDGRDDHGFVQPGGVYLFRLDSRLGGISHTVTTKGILLK